MKTNNIRYSYRFEVKRIQEGKIVGTGRFILSKKDLPEQKLVSFLHEYTNNMYKKDLAFLSIKIYESQF